MRKFLRRFFCALLSLVLVAAVSTAIAVPAVIRSRGDLSDYMVSEEHRQGERQACQEYIRPHYECQFAGAL